MVVVLLGEWVVMETGVWDFIPKQGELSRCFMLTSRLRFEELVVIVKEKFQICATKAVNFSYRCPEWMVMCGEGITPPASITSDDDVNVFEAICSHIEKVNLCVMIRETEEVDPFRNRGVEIWPKIGKHVKPNYCSELYWIPLYYSDVFG